MKNATLPTLLVFLLLGLAMDASAQCQVGDPCDDLDPCTGPDQITLVLDDTPECGPGEAEFPNPPSNLSTASLPPASELLISPFPHDVHNRRFRKQYMFLRSELDISINQLSDPYSTQGLGTCEPVTAIGFYIDAPVTTTEQKNWQFVLTIKHALLGINNLTGGFDNSVDAMSGCASSTVMSIPALSNGPGWSIFPLSTPFLWDGTRNVIVEIAATTADEQMPGVLPVRYTNTSAELTYAAITQAPYPPGYPCSPTTPTYSPCEPDYVVTAMGDCGQFGASALRPSVRFIGGVDTVDPPECLCVGALIDSDLDGIADCDDVCPDGPDPGMPCDDGNAETMGDVVNENCECFGVAMNLGEGLARPMLHAWPNPCTTDLLQLDRAVSGTLRDALGRPLLRVNAARTVNMAGIPSGAYLLTMDDGQVLRIVRY